MDRNTLYWVYPHYGIREVLQAVLSVLATYKSIYFFEDQHKKLYDLLVDIGGGNNLADDLPILREMLYSPIKLSAINLQP